MMKHKIFISAVTLAYGRDELVAAITGILGDLNNMGVGDEDCQVDGGDAVEYLNDLRNDLIKFLKAEKL